MIRIVVANDSELLRHLSASPFRRMSVEVEVVATGAEAVEAARRERPHLVVLDAEMAELSGYDAARAIKRADAGCRVMLVMAQRIGAETMRRVAESGCDEVLIAPMRADELYDAVAVQLSLLRRSAERGGIDLPVVVRDGPREIDARVTNLSVAGARLLVPEPLGEGSAIELTIGADELEAEPLRVSAQVVWSRSTEDATVAGVAFAGVDESTRARLSRLTQWEVIDDGERPRVVIKGAITGATGFDDLVPALGDGVDFDLSQVSYISSLGVRRWSELLERAPAAGCRLHACSIPFVLQASLAREMVGRASVASFYAPYACRACGYGEERELEAAAVVASGGAPPTFSCPACDGELALDDAPERYLAFLGRDDGGSGPP